MNQMEKTWKDIQVMAKYQQMCKDYNAPPRKKPLNGMGMSVWWLRTATKNIQICRNYFCYFFNFDLLLILLFKISESEFYDKCRNSRALIG